MTLTSPQTLAMAARMEVVVHHHMEEVAMAEEVAMEEAVVMEEAEVDSEVAAEEDAGTLTA